MLILRRKAGEALLIGEDVKITVLDVGEKGVRLAIDAPREIPILRQELLRAMDANRDAANEQASPEDLIKVLGAMAPSPQTEKERETGPQRQKGERTP